MNIGALWSELKGKSTNSYDASQGAKHSGADRVLSVVQRSLGC